MSGIPDHQKDPTDDPLKGFSDSELLELLRKMLLFRRFEEKAEESYAIGKIGGFCHLHIGQEGSAAGSITPLRSDDYLVTAYREHTQALARGVDPSAVMAELYGKASGSSSGKGGSMHIFAVDQAFMGGHGIVGGQVPLAAGMGWAIKYRGEDRVAMCFMGEAAVNQGAFHEALNMAAIWQLPVIFVVENNEYGMGTAFGRVSATKVEERSAAYQIPASVVNGQEVLETYRHFERLVKEVREGGGPRFVEVRTYRFRGHSMSDPVSGTYRSKAEVSDQTETNDPIKILRDRLFAADVLSQEALEIMDQEVRSQVDEAVEFADAAPVPDSSELYTNVYSQINEHGRLFFDGRDR
ncbi:MAG: pyruvate dehydrogenase (acetyl-transferring) E1 component subunit alpha [Gemmatimonadetes bacterium]|nr:pyruvate dehydrogenase (acetyl-transferring) E1 component subunit alpha [Gemmatimonadota bacterium]NNM06283.1 pyruvate dehydrogenase (acetyl-transferring) E1 component subunit alpha [Gemmatimonadota bacterium]